jgi:hypothetical protein
MTNKEGVEGSTCTRCVACNNNSPPSYLAEAFERKPKGKKKAIRKEINDSAADVLFLEYDGSFHTS